MPFAASKSLALASRSCGRLFPINWAAARIAALRCSAARVASVREARILASDGTPLRGQAQISLTRSDTSTTLQLISAQAISEPALRVVVEVATPTASVRREYGVLLDLPAAAAAKASEDGAAATEPLAPAAEAPAPEAKPAPAASEALPPEAAPVAAPVKPRKHLTHRTPKSPAASKLAKAPAAVAPAELAHAPANTDARLEDKSAAKPSASVAPDKTGTGDHLVLSAPTTLGEAAAKRPAADQDEAAAKRFAEMDQRVKDLTEEIVRLRTELAAQKQHEAELIVQANRSGDNWLYAVLGAIGASAVALVLWTRRRNATPAWSPATWEQGNNQNPEGIESVVGPQDHELESLPGATVSRPGAAASAPLAAESAPKPAATLATQQPFRSARKSASTAVNSDPITISPLTTPIEVTEVLAHEPSIEQLYTLFYDIGGNTMPGATPRPGATPQPNTVLPPVALPKHDNLDIDLGIPESIQPVKASRTLGAMTPAALALGAAGAASASGTSFTYEEKPASAQGPSPVAGNLEPQTSFGPMTEIPRDMEFAKTQPGLDLDLTTNIGTASQLGPLTVIPADADAAKAPVASAPTHPAGLELDLSTNIGTSTEIGPLTVIPRDEEGPMTRVELDLDLNTNVQPLSANDDGMERESDPFAITTIPGNWAKSSG